MKALLLAAGFGTRLSPLTNTVPKCLVKIKGKPLLSIWLERLVLANIGPFLINTHYLANQVDAYIEGSPYSELVTLMYERKLCGTAGTLISNLDFFEYKDCLLIHADNYCLADFNEFKQAHMSRPSRCLMTMMTFRTSDPSSCGIVELDDQGVIIGFHEKKQNPPGDLANGAVYILSSELLKILASDFSTATDFSTEIINRFIGYIYSYETKAIFIDIGTPENYKIANNTI
jgi:mannose-1-phosphate guanylyltransferase